MTEIARRLGKSPAQRGSMNGSTCPDVFELTNGEAAVIGNDRTEHLEPDVHLAPGQRVVIVDRATWLAIKNDIPEE